MSSILKGRPTTQHGHRFMSFCTEKNLTAVDLYQMPFEILDDYIEFLKQYHSSDRIALTTKSNQLYALPETAYVHPNRPLLVRYAFKRQLRVVSLIRRNLFKQALSGQIASNSECFHESVETAIRRSKRSKKETLIEIEFDILKAQRQMENSESVQSLVRHWFVGYPEFVELAYEDIFDENDGGLKPIGIEKIEDAFQVHITDRELGYIKLSKKGGHRIKNLDEVVEHFSGTSYKAQVEEYVA